MIIHNPRHDYMIHNTQVAGLGTIKKDSAPILCDLDWGDQLTALSPSDKQHDTYAMGNSYNSWYTMNLFSCALQTPDSCFGSSYKSCIAMPDS